jgi:FkbM family methyltransferase
MAGSVALHRGIRRAVRHYPWTHGAAWLSRALGRFFDNERPHWVVSDAFGPYPRLALDVSLASQRKVFYFPRAYGDLYWRRPLARLMPRLLRPGAAFLDIGANLGMFSILAARLVGPQGRVVAFEPEPRTFASLERTFALNGLTQARAFNVALSDCTTQATLYRSRDGFAHSLLPETPGHEARYTGQVGTRVTTLDDLSLTLPNLRLVKIDVEGEEPRTVAGMRRTLAAAGRPPIWCEVRGPRGSTRAPNTFAPVCQLLGELGYRPFRWDGEPTAITPADVRGREDILFTVSESVSVS